MCVPGGLLPNIQVEVLENMPKGKGEKHEMGQEVNHNAYPIVNHINLEALTKRT